MTADTTLTRAVHLQELRAAHATIAAATLTMKAYYHLDAIGSVRALTNSAGAVLERHDYTAFGEELTSPTGLDTRRFGGKERDPETGLAYFAARYYAPETGRFAQADDPAFGNVFDPQSLNQYGYTSGNPLRRVDPSGHQAQCVETPSNTCVVGKLPKPEVISWAPISGLPDRLAGRFSEMVARVGEWLAPQDQRPCEALPTTVVSFGLGGTVGGSLMPLLSPFLGGGVSIGVSYPGLQLVGGVQGSAMMGPGMFAGVGGAVTVSHSATGLAPGLSNSWDLAAYAEANAAWGSGGAGVAVAANREGQSVTRSTRFGTGYGVMAGAGASMSRTYATKGIRCR